MKRRPITTAIPIAVIHNILLVNDANNMRHTITHNDFIGTRPSRQGKKEENGISDSPILRIRLQTPPAPVLDSQDGPSSNSTSQYACRKRWSTVMLRYPLGRSGVAVYAVGGQRSETGAFGISTAALDPSLKRRPTKKGPHRSAAPL